MNRWRQWPAEQTITAVLCLALAPAVMRSKLFLCAMFVPLLRCINVPVCCLLSVCLMPCCYTARRGATPLLVGGTTHVNAVVTNKPEQWRRIARGTNECSYATVGGGVVNTASGT